MQIGSCNFKEELKAFDLEEESQFVPSDAFRLHPMKQNMGTRASKKDVVQSSRQKKNA
jgi:hypothetical protein